MTDQPEAVDVAFDRLLKSLLLERMTGMPRWNLTPAPKAEPIPKVRRLPEEQAPLPTMSRGELAALETAHLIGTDTPEAIARRLGYSSTASLERTLVRAARPDLAAAIRRKQAS